MEQEDKRQQIPPEESFAEMGRLIAILIVNILKKSLRLLLKCIARFILFIIMCCIKGWQLCVKGWHAWLVFWHDDNTQQKVAKARRTAKYLSIKLWKGTKKLARLIAKWSMIALRNCGTWLKQGSIALGMGIVIGIKSTIQGIIHLRTTAITLWHKSKQAKRGFRLWRIRKRRSYAEFKRTKGFRGLAEEWGRDIKKSANDMMDEDQEEASPEAVTEEDIIDDELLPNSHAKKLSDKIIRYLQDIIDEN